LAAAPAAEGAITRPNTGPRTTIYNRIARWAERGVWENLFRKLAGSGRSADTQMIDSTHVKAHRVAFIKEDTTRF
jgi:transposase